MSNYFICPFFHAGVQFTTNVGAPLANGRIYTYQAGTTNAFSTWTSNTGAANNPNPIILDFTGRLTQEIWLQYAQPYKFIVTDSSNNPVGPPLDNISGVNDTSESFNQVIVINSVSSSDTSNAASANAVKWAYNEANLAYTAANNAGNLASQAYTAANNAANAGVSFYSNNHLIHTGNQLNFNNTSTANISVTSNTGGEVNVSIVANGAASSIASNGYGWLPSGQLLQYGSFNCINGSVAVNFPTAFPNNVFAITVEWAYSSPDAGFVSSSNTSAFIYTNGNGGLCYFMAVGN